VTYLLDVEQKNNPLKSKFIINRQRAAIPRAPAPVFQSVVNLQGCVNIALPLPDNHRFGDGAELAALRALDEGTGESDVSPIKTRFEERIIAAMSLGCGFEPVAARAPPFGQRNGSNEGDEA
jgi:hypothetical protein